MITLYGSGSPNVLKVFLTLEELGLDYEFRQIDVTAGDQYLPEFSSLNPNHKVPVIVDQQEPGGTPYPVFESGAILMYLAEKTGRFWPPGLGERYEVIQWLMIQMSGIGPMFGQFNHFARLAGERCEYAYSRYRTETLRLFDVLNGRLGKVPYLGGQEYSIADMATWPWVHLVAKRFSLLKFEELKRSNVQRWYEAIAARPATQRVTRKCDEMTARDLVNSKSYPPENVDRLFGRGRYARG